MNCKLDKLFIGPEDTIKRALKRLDEAACKALVVADGGRRLLGMITDGDIRRFILKGDSLRALGEPVEKVYNRNPVFLKKGQYDDAKIRDLLVEKNLSLIPIINENEVVVDYVTVEKLSIFDDSKVRKTIDPTIPVVIMAGGKGTRLEPFTSVFPKPLIPIGNRTMVEHVISQFTGQGASRIYMILNYKGAMIESYFSGIEHSYSLECIEEKEYQGTAGGLKLLCDRIDSKTIIVTNCDILVKADYDEIIRQDEKENAALTMISSLAYVKVQYGIVDFKEGGVVTGLREKPEYPITLNTGVYILSRDVLDRIPENEKYDMTDMINGLLRDGRKVLTYPVNEKDYMDIGQWDEYKKAVGRLVI